jgi:2-polyprenyl-6-methoxyphenol hydroxylase-like FAD-dependent oxidoreductase
MTRAGGGDGGKLRCVVVGAGIGGLASALSLHEVGAEVEVFDSVRRVSALGVGINLLPHAVRELDAMGLLERLDARGVTPTRLLYCTRRGQEIWQEPRGVAAGYPWPQLSIHRGVLQEVLLEAVVDRLGAGALQLGRRLVRIDDDDGGDGRVAAVFDDGSVAAADVVVAADGIHSAARRQRYPDEGPPRWNGALLWRGIAEIDPVLDGRTMIWAGHPDQKFVGYPIADLEDGRQAFNFVAELRRPDSDLAGSEDWNRLGSLDDFLPQFDEWDFGWLDVPAIIRAAPETYLFPMVDRDPVARWTFGRSTLLGDAAHPMYPIGSNGASQAILDARVLAGCVRRHADDLDQALARYEEARRPATGAIVEANRGLGPELPMLLVEQRAPEGFADIADVITPEEIGEVTEGYRRTAGFSLAALQRGTSLFDEPYGA